MLADMEDSGYFEKRAIELLHEAGADRLTMLSCELAQMADEYKKYKDAYHQKMNKAIQLIVLARIVEQ